MIEEAEHIRGKTLTPESPKPVHYPSPSNIPILEDPMFNEPALSIDTPASFQTHPQQMQTPSAHSSTPFYAEQQSTNTYQNVAAQGSAGVAPPAYAQSVAFPQTQDTSSIQNFSALHNAPAHSLRDASPASAPPDSRPAFSMPHDPNAHASSAQGGVDYQALLDSLSSAAAASAGAPDRYAAQMSAQPFLSQGNTPASSLLPAAPNLPPRPPPQDKPSTHPNYNPNDDIRSYHPHSQKPSSGRGSVSLQPVSVGAGTNPGTTQRPQQSPSTPGYGSRQSGDQQPQRSETPDDEDIRWPPEINKVYEEFLDDERRFVTDGQWDQFPMGSRLFIGNLPTEKVTKRDIFHRFFRHGKLAQISIKQAYGFVQFMDSASCHKALQAEQGQAVRGRKMHLEVSKPQRNTKKADPHAAEKNNANNNNNNNNGARRRSRSPDYSRGGTGPMPRNERYGGNQNALSPRDRENRRFRDDYRPMRSPTPPRGGRMIRSRDRSRDRYDRRRSRSRSPRRYRSPSPRRDNLDDLPLPHRPAHQVPDVQVIVLQEGLPRDFIRWVEDTFRRQGLRIDVLILSPRLSEAAVIRRQIVEGVLAIVRLDSASLTKGKINVQVFDRRGGESNIQFNEYADLDPATAAALVMNQRQQLGAQPVQPAQPQPQPPATYGHSYGMTPFASAPPQPSSYSTPASNPPPNNQDIQRLISSLDPNGLSQLLGAMSGNSQAQVPQPQAAGLSPELIRLLGSVSTPSQPPAFPSAAQPPPFSNAYQNSALASLLGGQAGRSAAPPVHTPTQSAPPSGQPDMNEIMAQLAKYQR